MRPTPPCPEYVEVMCAVQDTDLLGVVKRSHGGGRAYYRLLLDRRRLAHAPSPLPLPGSGRRGGKSAPFSKIGKKEEEEGENEKKAATGSSMPPPPDDGIDKTPVDVPKFKPMAAPKESEGPFTGKSGVPSVTDQGKIVRGDQLDPKIQGLKETELQKNPRK